MATPPDDLHQWKPSAVLWYAFEYLVERATLHDLRALRRELLKMHTRSRATGIVEDAIVSKAP